MGSGFGSTERGILYGVVGGSAGVVALLILLLVLFSVLLCVIVKKFRKIERHLGIVKSAGGGHKKRNDMKTPDPIALTETELTNNEVYVPATPTDTPDPDAQKPSKVEPVYSDVKKKRPSVKVEQYNDFGDPGTEEQPQTNNPESDAGTQPQPKSPPWTVQVDSAGYSHLRHASTDERQRKRLNPNRYSMPTVNEQFSGESGVLSSGIMPQPYIAPKPLRPTSNQALEGKHTYTREEEDTPPPIPSRLSTSFELVLESNDKEGENSGKHPTQYQNMPQPVINEMLYDEVSHTAPVKTRPAYDVQLKTNFGPECLYDEIK